MSINKSIAKVQRGSRETDVREKISALRVELSELVKRDQEGRVTYADMRRADEIAHEIHELQGAEGAS